MVDYVRIAQDAENSDSFLRSITALLQASASKSAEILILCPCSPKLEAYAESTGTPPAALVRGITTTLRELYNLHTALPAEKRLQITARLHAEPPILLGYEYDNRVLLKHPDLPADDPRHIELPTSSAYGTAWTAEFESRWHAGLPMMRHMTGELAVQSTAESRITHIPFVIHGRTSNGLRHTYLAIDHPEVVETLVSQPTVTWWHGTEEPATFTPIPLSPAEDEKLLNVLHGRFEDKYGYAASRSFFRLEPILDLTPLSAAPLVSISLAH